MTSIKEVTDYLESIAPLSLQESYDNSGLIVGDHSNEVKGILIALDCLEEVIDEAVKQNCNLVITHHPIVFSGLKKLNGKNYVERTIIKAIRNNIAIYAIHTNLDNVYAGVNKKICDVLGLKNLKVLSPRKNVLRKLVTFCPVNDVEKVRSALFEAGGGKIGNYDEASFNISGTGTFRPLEGANPYIGEIGVQHRESEIRIETIFPNHLESQIVAAIRRAHPYEEVAYDIYSLENSNQEVGSGMVGELSTEMEEMEFLEFLKFSMKSKVIRHSGLFGRKIKRIAVCGGSGSFLLNDAIKEKADFFVTADYKYHQFFDAEGRIIIADIGHFESEQFTMDLLKELIVRNFSTFAVRLTELVTNPVHYY
ncbi:MAG: Nif3-like dinuclear metal center hexameric protein, partial [Bacteroidetes bacterium]|nr:Nif3-like dinuclear metal center hexameric protein [Bacteroidota bacterium]